MQQLGAMIDKRRSIGRALVVPPDSYDLSRIEESYEMHTSGIINCDNKLAVNAIMTV